MSIHGILQQDVLQLNHALCYELLPFVYFEHATEWFPVTAPCSCFECKSLQSQLWKSRLTRICKNLAKVPICTFQTGIWDSFQALLWILWKAESLFLLYGLLFLVLARWITV